MTEAVAVQPSIVDVSAFTIIGLEAPFIHALSPDANASEVLGALWNAFLPRAGEVPSPEPECRYGIIHPLPEPERRHPDELQYLVGVKAAAEAEPPAGMIAWQVPAGAYAVFSVPESDRPFPEFLRYIYREWLPTSGCEHAMIADVERHRETSDGGEEIEYWISITRTET